MDIRDFAVSAHGDQKYGADPYVSHLDQVWSVLQQYGYCDPIYRTGAYIHDILEDCVLQDADSTKNLIMVQRLDEAVGYSTIAMYVAQFCKDEDGPSRRVRKALTYARCRLWIERDWLASSVPLPSVPIAVRVKVTDRLANIRNCRMSGSDLLSMYRKEKDAFRNALHVAGMCDEMWEEYDLLLSS